MRENNCPECGGTGEIPTPPRFKTGTPCPHCTVYIDGDAIFIGVLKFIAIFIVVLIAADIIIGYL